MFINTGFAWMIGPYRPHIKSDCNINDIFRDKEVFLMNRFFSRIKFRLPDKLPWIIRFFAGDVKKT